MTWYDKYMTTGNHLVKFPKKSLKVLVSVWQSSKVLNLWQVL